jgi:hypothetical protein
MIPSGIEPAIFRFVAQNLNNCATAVPLLNMDISFMLSGKKSIEITGGKCDIENCWNFL